MWYPSSKICKIDNGVKVEEFQISKDRRWFVHAARWHPMKNYPYLVECIKNSSKKATFLLLGNGANKDNSELVRMLSGFHSRVLLNGVMTRESMPWHECRALLITSLYGEALPMIGLEALAAGVPVLTTDVGSCRELVVHHWQCVETDDVDSFVQAIETILTMSQEEYIILAHESWKIADKKFNWTKTFGETKKVLEV
jgi:glycosyltransferase involved in cell wall biosynthesis